MRVWDIPSSELCNKHLVGEHAEIHAVFSVIANGKTGYALHPEVVRWRGHLGALVRRHDDDVAEMTKRGFKHASPLPATEDGATKPPGFVDPVDRQRELLRAKGCDCGLERPTAAP